MKLRAKLRADRPKAATWHLCIACAAVVAASAASARAQEPALAQAPAAQDLELVELRVTATQPRVAIVDRGESDGLALGDRVVFRPFEGGVHEGTVIKLSERAAAVEMIELDYVPAPGTRGDVRVPRDRRAAAAPTPAPDAAPTPVAPEQPAVPEHPPWERDDSAFTPDKPLLSQVQPVRPEERRSRIRGHVYSIADQIWSSEDDRTDAFYRLGGRAEYENFLGHGGRLLVDGEVNWRNTDVPDGDDESKTRVRLDRFSYAWGGTRFEPTRFEIGRFLQNEMPEFGVLDGVEWNRRVSTNSSFGASVGFLPEPDAEQKTGDDLALAAWYRWNRDESQEVTAAIGFQKTFHDLTADRDLVVARLEVLPPSGWNLHGTLWIDVYSASDTAKGSGVEITQAYVRGGRRWTDGSSVDLIYTHLAFPELDRDEFLPVTAAQLADDHLERLALRGRGALSQYVTLDAECGGWTDEDDTGGDAELGFGLRDVLVDGSRFEVSAFGVDGRFSRVVGARGTLGKLTAAGDWSVGYEFAQHVFNGFGADNNELPQHRARAQWRTGSLDGWSVSLHADVALWDSENAVLVGIYLQRSF